MDNRIIKNKSYFSKFIIIYACSILLTVLCLYDILDYINIFYILNLELFIFSMVERYNSKHYTLPMYNSNSKLFNEISFDIDKDVNIFFSSLKSNVVILLTILYISGFIYYTYFLGIVSLSLLYLHNFFKMLEKGWLSDEY